MQEEQIHGNIEYDSCRAWQKNKTKEISVAEAVTVSLERVRAVEGKSIPL